MAKRKKRNRSKTARIQKTINNQAPQQVEQQAIRALAAERYKLAIQCLKSAAKQTGESLPETTLQLFQQAYTGRAEELAKQGMVKEAIAIWEAAAQYDLDMADSRYIGWLIKTQNHPRLLTIYHKIPVEQQRGLYPHLAAALLAGETRLLESLPENDPALKDYEAARTLLENWCAGADANSLREQMQAISFRSPYRDLRQIIQAWLLLETSPDKVEQALQRIPADSPFQPLVTQIHFSTLSVTDAMTRLPAMSLAEKTAALDIRGWTDQTAIIRKLESLQQGFTEKKLFSVLSGIYKAVNTGTQRDNNQLAWLAGALKKTWVHLMVDSELYSPDHGRLRSILGKLSAVEFHHLEGLFAIADRAPVAEIIRTWQTYRKHLQADDSQIAKSDQRLMSALILRYLADVWKKYQGNSTSRSIGLLEESLQEDPTDPDSWAEVIEYYLHKRKLKPARDALNAALDHYPDHIALLELGIQVSIAGNVFKKAAAYAKQILEVDPINTRVQQHLQNAHIAHARKVYKQGKFHLVHKELDEAQHWKGSALNKNILAVLQAFLSRAEDGAQTPDPLKLLAEQSDDPVQLDFIIRHEAHATGQDSNPLITAAGLTDLWKSGLLKRLKKENLLRLIDTAQQYYQIDADSIKSPLDELYLPLLKLVKSKFSAEEGEQICEFWLQTEQTALLQEYAKKLETVWPDEPVFTYYRYAGTRHYDSRAIQPLENAWNKARDQGDMALAARLGVLLDRLANPFAGQYGYDDPEDDFFDFMDDPDADPLQPGADQAAALDMLMSGMADSIQTMPLPAVKDFAKILLGKENMNDILKTFGEQSLRDLCESALRGEPMEKALKKLEKKLGNPLPFRGF